MITIRLSRVGRKNDPSFRVIVVESKRKPQPGNYIENVGSYDPRTDRIELKAERIKHWIANGATTSETVHNLLVSNKIIDADKINVLPRKSPPKKEEVATPAALIAETVEIEAHAEEPKEDNSVAATQATE
jgi:small subunit ribosomal protein S16